VQALLRGIAADLVRNNPFAARGSAKIAEAIVGAGITFQVYRNGKVDDRLNDIARRHLDKATCDAGGRHDLYGLQLQAARTIAASRNATWGPTLAYDYAGAALPLAGAKISMELRLYPGQPGDPKLRIAEIPFVDTLVSGKPDGVDEIRRLTLSPFVTLAQLLPLPQGGEAGDAATFAFDIRIAYADGVSEILASGNFILLPGVTTT
jgi:hypothetical protein